MKFTNCDTFQATVNADFVEAIYLQEVKNQKKKIKLLAISFLFLSDDKMIFIGTHG